MDRGSLVQQRNPANQKLHGTDKSHVIRRALGAMPKEKSEITFGDIQKVRQDLQIESCNLNWFACHWSQDML